MADEVVIRVEPGEPDPEDEGGWGGPGASSGSSTSSTSSRRLVRGRSRWRLVAAGAALAGLAAAGLVSLLGDDGGGGDRGPDREREPAGAAAPRVAWAEATLRLEEAGSFAYRGTVHASRAGALLTDTWLAADVTVEGAVVMGPEVVTREVAVAPNGEAAETVTSAFTAWTRTASSRGGLGDAPWRVTTRARVGERPVWSDRSVSSRLGVALVPNVVASTGNRRSDPPDDSGRRVLHGTVPSRNPAGVHLLPGAEVSLTVDEHGDIERVVISYGPAGDPQLAMDLTIDHVGEPGLVTPADVGEPARRAVSTDVLEAAGIRAVEPAEVPEGWALTDAQAFPQATTIGPEVCPRLVLQYRDLGPGADGHLSLSIASDACTERAGERHAWPDRFRAGAFSGSIGETPRGTAGMVSDGVTAVDFETTLSVAEVRAVLASLVPFDARAEP